MKFKELRKSKSMTQCELANAIGCTQQAVANWENGVSKPTTDSINKIALVFNCTAQTVFDCFFE